jgi:hypothetical protein
MKKNEAIFIFEDVSIRVNTQNDDLIRYINEYCYMTRSKTVVSKNIVFNYREAYQPDCSGSNIVPANAQLVLDVPFYMDGVSNLKCFSKSGQEFWYFYEGVALVSINYATKEITAFLILHTLGLNIQSFILLFIHPLISVLGDFGYYRLHAACLKVGQRHVLITGLSGRGKSTATLALLKRGHPVLADEMPLFKLATDGFHVYALFNMIKLRQSALDQFFSDFNRIHFRTGEDCYIKLSDLNQAEFKKLYKVHDLFILEQTGEAATRIEAASCLNVAPEMFPTALNIFDQRHAEADFQSLAELLATVDCYKVFFGTDLEQFGEQVEKLAAGELGGQEETA